MFSPDGSQIVFAHTDVEHQAQHLRVADVSATPNPTDVLFPELPDFLAVPAWSDR